MIPVPYDQPATEYALSENLTRVLELGIPELFQRLLQVPTLVPHIQEALDQRLGFLDDLDPSEQSVVINTLSAGPEALEQVSRIIAVLTQSSTLSICTKGETLRLVTEFCGTQHVLKLIRDGNYSDMQMLPPLAEIRLDHLEYYASQVMRFLLGILPRSYQLRFALRHPAGTIPETSSFPPESGDHEIFLSIAGNAFPLISEAENEAIQDT